MIFIGKAYSVVVNLIYLFILSKTTKNVLKFKFPRIDSGLKISIFNRSYLNLNNLLARNNLKLFINNGSLYFGEGCFVNNDCSFNCLDRISIGENSIFGEGIKVYDHDHRIGDGYIVSKNEFVTAPICIGSNCWIGSNTVILKGVNIADNVIIGANSLVNKSIVDAGIYVSKNGSLVKIK